MRPPRPLLFALSLLAVSTAFAKTYRWVDENGVTIYSQTPPPSGEATEIKPPPPPAEDPEEARRRLEQRLQRFEDRREDKELANDKLREDQSEAQRFATNCTAAKQNFSNLEAAARRLIKTTDGEYKRLPEEERQQRMREALEQIEKYCN